MSSMLTKALKLAEQGFHVFPLVPGSKQPAIKNWQTLATRDPHQITQWFTDFLDRPTDNNIGICTTRFGDDKALLVIDIDVKNGVNGFDIVNYDKPLHVSVTPTGGQHWIYVVDQPVKQGAHKLGKGLDVRSWGGYIVAPGSLINGSEYKWSR